MPKRLALAVLSIFSFAILAHSQTLYRRPAEEVRIHVQSNTTQADSAPDTVLEISELMKRCPEFKITMTKDEADYVVLANWYPNIERVSLAVIRKGGAPFYITTPWNYHNAFKDACNAIRKDIKVTSTSK